jgi:hypothetical protein
MANEITQELIVEFMERMRLTDDESTNLTRILKTSIEDLINKCGDYDVHTNEVFKELVFERSRYAYNDAIEYFDGNFVGQLINLALSKRFGDDSNENFKI